MQDSGPSDPELLAAWLKHHREPAFHELVARYAGLVHATARRACADESMAVEVSQLTFITLAGKAKSLTSCASLGGWLHRTAMMHARNLNRQNRREARKRQHLAMQPVSPQNHPGESWRDIQPLLDDALAALPDKDREALLLRFYRSLSVKDVAATLGIATDAAQKRIDRAIGRLRGKLAARGCQAGGSLGGVMLAGFAADAQAAALPVSVISSKAIAAGAAGSFGLITILTSLATLMKTTSWIAPLATLVLAGAWTGTKYQSLAAAEANNEMLRDALGGIPISKGPGSVKISKDAGPINWQKLAAEVGNGPEMRRLQMRLKSMEREEMIAALDQIAGLEISKARRSDLESAVATPLGTMDPEWLLNRFNGRLRDVYDPVTLQLHAAFGQWAKKDSSKATAWLDARIAAGDFNSKRLDESTGTQPRDPLEARLIGVLLTADPVAATRRLGMTPEKLRIGVMSYLTGEMFMTPVVGGSHLAFANLVRSQMPTDLQASILLFGGPNVRTEDNFPKFVAYMDAIQATPAERISCMEEYSGSFIYKLSVSRKVTAGDVDTLREQFVEISPPSVDAMTARSLAMAMKQPFSKILFPQASDIAVHYLETSGSDAVLATFLEVAEVDESNKALGRELAGKITDDARREEILRSFE